MSVKNIGAKKGNYGGDVAYAVKQTPDDKGAVTPDDKGAVSPANATAQTSSDANAVASAPIGAPATANANGGASDNKGINANANANSSVDANANANASADIVRAEDVDADEDIGMRRSKALRGKVPIAPKGATPKVDAYLPGKDGEAIGYSVPPTVSDTDEMLRYLEQMRDDNEPLTKEKIAKLRRKQRTAEIFGGITDAARSLANLYYTTQYAPNGYDPSKNMSEAARQRWEKIIKDRQDESDRYYNYALKGHSLRMQQAAQQSQQAYREREQERKDAWDNWRMAQGELENEIKAKQLEIAQAAGEAKNKAQEELAQMYKARTELYRRTPSMGSRGSSRAAGEYPWYDRDGNLHYAHSYEAMRQNAKQHGTWQEGKSSSKRVKKGGNTLAPETVETEKDGKGTSVNPKARENAGLKSGGKAHAGLKD